MNRRKHRLTSSFTLVIRRQSSLDTGSKEAKRHSPTALWPEYIASSASGGRRNAGNEWVARGGTKGLAQVHRTLLFWLTRKAGE
jgi:hypothetical protein